MATDPDTTAEIARLQEELSDMGPDVARLSAVDRENPERRALEQRWARVTRRLIEIVGQLPRDELEERFLEFVERIKAGNDRGQPPLH